ncbi:hypothetical protein RN50_01671 [Microbacterium foliorum]|uniref:Uncharacterized protein n=1 Tax=Microbacterium foliorum TaxID=104336 RepID=A0A0F0KNT9_9MICO|nr:hypothetical protein RN50_01671 [Microbacterium foliorum]
MRGQEPAFRKHVTRKRLDDVGDIGTITHDALGEKERDNLDVRKRMTIANARHRQGRQHKHRPEGVLPPRENELQPSAELPWARRVECVTQRQGHRCTVAGRDELMGSYKLRTSGRGVQPDVFHGLHLSVNGTAASLVIAEGLQGRRGLEPSAAAQQHYESLTPCSWNRSSPRSSVATAALGPSSSPQRAPRNILTQRRRKHRPGSSMASQSCDARTNASRRLSSSSDVSHCAITTRRLRSSSGEKGEAKRETRTRGAVASS